jgi:hypothetical protein
MGRHDLKSCSRRLSAGHFVTLPTACIVGHDGGGTSRYGVLVFSQSMRCAFVAARDAPPQRLTRPLDLRYGRQRAAATLPRTLLLGQ